ncbi:sulfotransferase 2A8-like isoform X2 [Watersipora subatra]
MGCNQSSAVQSNGIKEEPAGSKQHADETEESQTLERFNKTLMTRLQAIANDPPAMPKPLVEGDPRMMLIPSLFNCEQTLAELKEKPLPADSVLIVTYLKSGTHWVWEIVKMLHKRKATADNLPKETAHMEILPPSVIKEVHGKELQEYVTHFPMWTLPSQSYSGRKLVYVYRNPKDVCVSLYYHYMAMSKANPTGFPEMPFEAFFGMFLGPPEANLMGTWFDHVADFWDNFRSNPDILCIQYEQMIKDPEGEIKRIDEHLGTKASENLLKEIAEATSFTTMKQAKAQSEKHLEIVFKGTMYRKGKVGDWKTHLNDEQNEKMEEAISAWQSKRAEPVPLMFEI